LMSINCVVEYFLVEAPPLPVEEVVTTAGQSFDFALSEASLDTLYFVLATLNHLGAGVSPDLVQESFGFKDLTKKSNLAVITSILAKTTLPLANVVNHPVLKALVPLVSEKKTAKRLFSQLLPHMNTAYKGQIGIALLRECLAANPSNVEDLLSSECLEVLRSLCLKGVVEPVIEIMDIMENKAKEGKIDCWTMLSRLLECTVCWDKHVPGNTVSFFISLADQDMLLKAGNFLKARLESDASTSDRVYAAGLIAKLIGHPAVINNIEWRVSMLVSLLELTVITVPNSQNPQLSKDGRYQLKDVFYRGLDSSCRNLSDLVSLVHSVMKHAHNLLDKKGGVPTMKALSDETKAAWNEVVSTTLHLETVWKKTKGKENGVFLMLFSHIGLQVFSQPEMALDVLSELQPVYANWKKQTKKDDPAGIEVVVEIMLSLLAQNKHILRNIVNCTFKVVSDQLTEPALQSILAVLNNEGNDDDEDIEDDEEKDEEDDEQEHEEDDEQEDEEDDEQEGDSDKEEVSDEEEDEESENDAEGTENQDAKERAGMIKTALGDHGEADDDIDMDDIPEEEMKKLDEKLVEAFKVLGGSKTTLEKKKEKLSHLANQHFKLRALDLVEIYVNHKPAAPLLFAIITALIERFKDIHNIPKEEQLCGRIKAILKKCSCVKVEDSDGFDSYPVLEHLLGLGTAASSAVLNLNVVHARLCLTALRVTLPVDPEKAETVYLDALNEFFANPQCTLVPDVFQVVVATPWKGAISIARVISEQSFNPKVRNFRRNQGIAILNGFLKNAQLDSEFPGQRVGILAYTLDKLAPLLQAGLGKGNPRHLTEMLTLLRGMKQKGLMTPAQLALVRQSLEECAKTESMAKVNSNVKKSFRKVLSYYDIKMTLPKAGRGKVGEDEKENEASPVNVPKKKKKKKNKAALKEKKEKKLEAAAAQDESSLPSFKGLLVDTTQVYKKDAKKKKMKKRKFSESSTKAEKKLKSE